MANYTTVSIVIQARSTSTRFPGKIFEKIGNKQILQHVLDACYNSSNYINARTRDHGIVCDVCLAVPTADKLIGQYSKHLIVEGSENDVLSRYMVVLNKLKSDFIVRITSDCPFIPPFIISDAIRRAVKDSRDYVTNADPRYRTVPDGYDVQVFSKSFLTWLSENAKSDSDREHVGTLAEQILPPHFSVAHIIGFADFSEVKLSVDTKEDLERLTKMHERLCHAVRNSGANYRL